MIDKQIEEFKKYVNNFDMTIDAIKMKYNHTMRVVEYAEKILQLETNDENIIRIGLIAALLHDIARFKQWTEYGTYKDMDSFDHGNMGYEILKKDDYINNYVSLDNEKEIILNAVLKHNKKYLELTNDELTDYVARLTRDADKIDILVNQYNSIDTNLYIYKNYLNEYGQLSDDQFNINDILVNDIVNHQLCSNKNIKHYFDGILREIAFIFDFNFKASFQIIKDMKIIDSKIELLRKYNKKEEDIEKIDLIEKVLNNYINDKLKES